MRTFTRRALSLAVALACIPVAQSIAQEQEETEASVYETITVSAQKRAEDVQDISVVVDSFSGDQLENMGISNAADISNISPGVVISNMTGDSTPTISIRGVGVGGASYFPSQPNSAAMNVDDVYLPSAIMSNFQIFDVERVEVLKGPQGTLFGRNSTSGAVNFFSVKPGEEGGFISTSYGSYNTSRIEGAYGAEINDETAFRFSAVNDYSDGNVINNFEGTDFFGNQKKAGEKVNGTDRFAARLQLLWDDGTTDVLASIHGGYDKSDIFQYQMQPAATSGRNLQDYDWSYAPECTSIYDPAEAVAAGCQTAIQEESQLASAIDGDNFATNANMTDKADTTASGATVNVNHDMGNVAITSITAFNSFERYYSEDGDGGPLTELHIFFNEEFDTFSQEVRLTSMDNSPFQWIIGAYYSDTDIKQNRAAVFDDYELKAWAEFDWVSPDSIVLASNLDETASALFTHATYELNKNFTLVAGLRYSSEEKTSDVVSYHNYGYVQGTESYEYIASLSTDCWRYRMKPSTCEIAYNDDGTIRTHSTRGPAIPMPPVSESWDNLSGKLGIEWHYSNDFLGFAHFSRGFKSGGFPGTIGVNYDRYQPYEPEEVDAFEIGAKTNFAEGAGKLNFSLFNIDYKNKQEYANFPGESKAFDFLNAADSSIKGFELQTSYFFEFDAYINFGVSYIDAKYDYFPFATDVVNGVTVVTDDRSGNVMPYAPEWSGNLMYSQFFDVGGGQELELTTNISYKDDQYFDSAMVKAFSSEAHFLWNARANLSITESLRLSVFVNNIADEEYRAGGVDQAVSVYGISYGKRRNGGIEVRYQW